MSDKVNHWKLGLLVVVSVVLAVSGMSWLGSRGLQRETRPLVCYFNESVQGLEVGSPVKMRGVMIGSVRAIGFASDRRHVEVEWDVFSDVLERLGLIEAGAEPGDEPVPIDLRVQLATTGITGAKFLLVDYFETPEPELPFETPINYVPSAPSTLKSLEDGLMSLAESLPGMVERAEGVADIISSSIREADVGGLAQQVQALVTQVETTLQELQLPEVREELIALARELRATSVAVREGVEAVTGDPERAHALLERWTGLAESLEARVNEAELGLTTSAVREAAGSYRGLAEEAGLVGGDLQTMLVDLSESLRAMRTLLGYLERDPGALLRGRVDSDGPPGGLPR